MKQYEQKAFILNVLKTNDQAVGLALAVILANQTSRERDVKITIHKNFQGFRTSHAKQGTIDAELFEREGKLPRHVLNFWRQPMTKDGTPRIGMYWRQLVPQE